MILSKPAGVWGAESGSNDSVVSVGVTWVENEKDDGLLATDLVRLSLERSSSGTEVIEVISNLVEKYGSDVEGKDSTKFCFVICDTNEAWILNFVGKLWCAEKLTEGFRRVTPGLSVQTKIDKSSDGLNEKALDLGVWDGSGDFNFSESFSADSSSDSSWPCEEPTSNFDVSSMFKILRSVPLEQNPQSSQVSTLTSSGTSCHWFTGTPNPNESVFKPFIFTNDPKISPLTQIPESETETLLHKLHSQRQWSSVGELLKNLENSCVIDLKGFLAGDGNDFNLDEECKELMKDCVEAEVKFYR